MRLQVHRDILKHLEVSEEEGWMFFPGGSGPATALHVWVHEANPDGVFARLNPESMFSRPVYTTTAENVGPCVLFISIDCVKYVFKVKHRIEPARL